MTKNSTHLRSYERLGNLDLTRSGFVIRKHTPVTALTTLFMTISVVVIAIAAIWYYDAMTGFYICIIAGGIMRFVAINLDRMQKLQQSNEFLNALLASAVGQDYRFVMIARTDGEIVYVNRAMQSAFPHFVVQQSLNLKILCSMQQAPESDAQKLFALVEQNRPGTTGITLAVGVENMAQNFTIRTDPIQADFVLVRGA